MLPSALRPYTAWSGIPGIPTQSFDFMSVCECFFHFSSFGCSFCCVDCFCLSQYIVNCFIGSEQRVLSVAMQTVLQLPPQLPLPPRTYYIGWVSVDWQRHCKTCRSQIEPDNPRVPFFLLCRRSVTAGDRVRYLFGVENLHSAKGEVYCHVPGSVCLVYGKPPNRQLHTAVLSLLISTLIANHGSGHTGS